jgi:hypothetical protein
MALRAISLPRGNSVAFGLKSVLKLLSWRRWEELMPQTCSSWSVRNRPLSRRYLIAVEVDRGIGSFKNLVSARVRVTSRPAASTKTQPVKSSAQSLDLIGQVREPR